MRFASALITLFAAGIATPALAQQGASPSGQAPAARAPQTIVVQMQDAKGNMVGTVQIRPTANGTLFTANLQNLPPGGHGFHVHERGQCDPPDFKSAGGHYNPAKGEHGFDMAKGPHAGDLPNFYASNQGAAIAEFHMDRLTLEGPRMAAGGQQQTTGQAGQQMGGAADSYPLLDNDGSAIIIHANPDDYRDQDSAGARIACGVIKAP